MDAPAPSSACASTRSEMRPERSSVGGSDASMNAPRAMPGMRPAPPGKGSTVTPASTTSWSMNGTIRFGGPTASAGGSTPVSACTRAGDGQSRSAGPPRAKLRCTIESKMTRASNAGVPHPYAARNSAGGSLSNCPNRSQWIV